MPPQISRLVDQIEGKARRAVVGGKCPPGWRFYRVAAKVPVAVRSLRERCTAEPTRSSSAL
jgi:hypothetical protein